MKFHPRFLCTNRFRCARILCALLLAGFASAAPLPTQTLSAQPLQRITTGSQGQGGGSYAALSADGQLVAFESPASDLAAQHISGSWDAYAASLQTQQPEIVSLTSSGKPVENPGDYTSPPAASQDGRYVAFESQAASLVGADNNGAPDIFLRDRSGGKTELVSRSRTGDPANGPSYTPAISADGRFVAFQSFASNLASGDTNATVDVFLRDRQAATTERISLGDGAVQGSDPHDYGFSSLGVSDDGRFVVFSYQDLPVAGSPAGQSVVYLRDRQARTTRLIAAGEYPALSANGRFIVFSTAEALVASDVNKTSDIYLFDTQAASFERISLPNPGQAEADTWITSAPDLSADGRFVIFETTAALLSQDTNATADIYLRDRRLKETTLLSTTPGGDPGNAESHTPSIDAAGATVAFTSLASDLVAGDTNQANDVFVRKIDAALPDLSASVFLPVVCLQ